MPGASPLDLNRRMITEDGLYPNAGKLGASAGGGNL